MDTEVTTLDIPTLAAAEFARGNWFQASELHTYRYRDLQLNWVMSNQLTLCLFIIFLLSQLFCTLNVHIAESI